MTISDFLKDDLVIVLVPGSHSTPAIYDLVSQSLRTKGYAALGVTLASACPANNQRWPTATLADDAFYIREVLQVLIHKGKSIIMVLCSYSGFPGTESLAQLPSRSTFTARTAETKQHGAIVGILYLSSFLPFPGDSLISLADQPPVKPGTYIGLPGITGPDIFGEWAKHGAERMKDIDYYFNQLITQSADSLDGKVTYNAWDDSGFQGKVEYLIGEHDATVSPSLRKKMIERVNNSRKEKVRIVEVAGAGHLMVLERPEEVVEAIERIVLRLME